MTLDPDREVPRLPCGEAPGTCPNNETHKLDGWFHADSWDEVKRWLEHGAFVADLDGDRLTKVVEVGLSGYGPYFGRVELKNYPESGFEYDVRSLLLEYTDIEEPLSPEEEAEALASIMKSFGGS